MGNIPIVQRSQVIPVSNAVQADAAAFNAPNVALGQLANAGNNAAQFLGGFALQKQQSENVAVVADADRQMKEAFASYQTELSQDGDETKWQEGWTKRLDTLSRDLFSNDKMAPVVKVELQEKFEDYKTKTNINVAAQVTKRSIQRSKAQVERSVELDLENGDIQSASKKINEGQAVGLYSPEEAQKRIEKAESRVDYYNASAMAQEDAEGTYELLREKTDGGRWRNFKNLSPDARKSLMGYARGEAGRVQSEFYSDMIFQTAEKGPLPIWQVEQHIANGKLTKNQGAAYINRFHSNSIPAFKPEQLAISLRAVEAYNKEADPYFEEYSKLTGDLLALPSKHSSFLLSRLQRKLNKSGVGGETQDFVLKRLGGMFNDNFFSGGESPDTPDAIADANIAYADMVEEAQQLISKNPNDSSSDIMEKLFKQPAASKLVIQKAKQVQSKLEAIEPTDEQKSRALNDSMFRFYQSQFKGITKEMTESEAITQAAKDNGGSLTMIQVRDIKRLYRRLQ